MLNEPRFSDEELESSCSFRSAATGFLEHEAAKPAAHFQINREIN